MSSKIDREQWVLANQMSSAIMNLNSVFCDGGPAEGPNEEWLEPIASMIAEKTTVFALEGAIPVLERALALAVACKQAREHRRR